MSTVQVSTAFPFSWHPLSDKMIGVGLSLCLLLGTPANAMGMVYFSRETMRGSCRNRRDNNRHFFTLVYLLVGITDFSISATGFPVAVSYFKNRDPCLFADHVFCSLWGFLWEIIPYMSGQVHFGKETQKNLND